MNELIRHELKNGNWYFIKKKQDWMMGKFIHNIMLANGYRYLPETMEELGFEWIEIDPELIFHTFKIIKLNNAIINYMVTK